jgi:hypothetical protein
LNKKAREAKETAFRTTTLHNAIEISVFKKQPIEMEVDQDGLPGRVPDPTGGFHRFPSSSSFIVWGCKFPPGMLSQTLTYSKSTLLSNSYNASLDNLRGRGHH